MGSHREAASLHFFRSHPFNKMLLLHTLLLQQLLIIHQLKATETGEVILILRLRETTTIY